MAAKSPLERATAMLHLLRKFRPATLAYKAKLNKMGVDIHFESPRAIGLPRGAGFMYSDSCGPDLAFVLKQLPIGPEDGIIDLGCGKAGALITMAEFPFGRIDGLDLSEKLIRIGRSNLEICRLKNATLYVADATTFDDLDPYTYLYFYNPFPEPVMEKVMENMRESLRRKPRNMTIVYFHPFAKAPVEVALPWDEKKVYDHSTHPIHVYFKAAAGSRT